MTNIFNIKILVILLKKMSESCLFGKGWGSHHKWTKKEIIYPLGFAQFYPMCMRHSIYICKECSIEFVHYYNTTPDIYKAMEKCDIPQECFTKEQSIRKIQEYEEQLKEMKQWY
jgi:hypothetical protein